MEGATLTLNDQQRIRISSLLSLEVAELSLLLEQLSNESHAASAINTLVQRLDQKAIQSASEESWRQQAEEAKASLSTQKIALEQRVALQETRVKSAKTLLAEAQQKLQTKSKEAEDAVAKAAELEAKLSSQQSGSLHSHVELQTLKARIETLEAEKRESLGALERKVTELEQANQDYHAMSARYQEVKKESSNFESESREAKASEMAHKLQKQAIEQELEMLKQRTEWANSELEAKSTEFNTYRSEKTAQILQLQADVDQARIEATTATQSSKNLQRRLQEQQTKLEETLQRNKDLQDQNVVQEEQFRVEMETQRRLGELWERAATDTKGRVADLELTLEDMQRTLSNKDSEYQETMSEISEEKVELQIKLEQSTMQIAHLKEEQKRADELLNKAGLMDTAGASGFDIGRMGVLSPTAAAAARLQKTGMSLTQVYSRYMELQTEHTQLKTENARLRESMDSIVQELSDGAPLIREQQLEYQRLEQHANELSAQLESAATEKEQIAFGAREALAQLDGVVRERDMLHKENQDLDRQVQNLLWRLKAPNAPQSLAPTSTLSTDTASMTEGEKAIDEHLVIFSNIQELQQQNKQLREIARKFTQEQEEAQGVQAQARKKEEQDVIEEAERVIEGMREDIGAKELQIATYKQELEMMRRILKTSNMRNVPAMTAAIENAGSASVGQAVGTIDQIPNGEASEYAKLLADLQKTFDAYRNETTIDNRHLKDQLQQTQVEKSDCRIQLGRAKTQIEILNERYQLLVENSTHQSNETSELRKRCNYLQESSTRVEIANQTLSSDLYTERDTASRLTAEVNNLKTEKALWKSFEARLLEENQALVKEKGHLNALLQTVQSMTNELERGSDQTKRRLESAVTSKEQEVETLKEKLKEEVESGKRLRDRRETEAKEWQTRIDTLQADYQTSREALIAAKTSLEHTNAKVEDLTKQIKSREDQLAIYQQKPAGSESTEATREEQLQAQMVQLHADLARHQAEADASRQHLAQFQAISQTNEDRLAEMTATFEEFKKEHDQKLEENAQTIKLLETKLSSAEERAESAASNLLDMQNKADEERTIWRKEKEELETKLRQLQNIQSQMQNAESRYRRDLQIQGSKTKEAHDNYERELLNHAKDIEALTKLKGKHNRQANELQQYRAASESALSNLQAAELSWEGQKSILQTSLSELEKRCSELKEQNDKLHRYLEDVSAQALNIEQRRNAPVESAEGEVSEGVEGADKQAELHDVIRYVRREKEILECQHELNLQESRRLKQQLDQTNRSLEETRSLLSEERNRHQEVMVSKQQHEQLMEKINQLNLLRESNTTLRAENDRLQKRVLRLENSGRELQRKLDPLNEQLREMKADLDFSKEELKQVGEDRDRWRIRTVEIMAKHDRIDPTEFQELKDKDEKHVVEKAQFEQSEAALKQSEAELKTENEGLKTLNEQLQARLKDVSAKSAKLSSLLIAWKARNAEDAAKMDKLQKDIEASKARIAELEKLLEEARKSGSENVAVTQEKAQLEKELKELKEQNVQREQNFEQLRGKLTISIQRNKQLKDRLQAVQAEKAAKEAADAAQPAATATAPAAGPSAEEIAARIEGEKQKLTAELTSKHENAIKMNEMRQQLKIQFKDKEIQALKSKLAGTGAAAIAPSNDDTAPSNAPVTAPASAPANAVNVPAIAPTNAPASPSPAAILSPMAQAFRPQGAAAPVRPTNAGRFVRTNPGAPSTAVPAETGHVARQVAGLPPRPGSGSPTVSPHQPRPTPGPGQSRLRPPLHDRVAAAAAAAVSSTPGPPAATPVPVRPVAKTPTPSTESVQTITANPVPATVSASAPAAATTSTPTPTPTPAPATAPPSGQPSRLVIKRRREEELPGNLSQPQSSSPSLSATTVEAGSANSPSMGPTAVVATSEQKPTPMIIKRQRQLPVEAPSTSTAETTPTPESKPQTITIQRARVVSTSDLTETQPASPPSGAALVVTEPTTSPTIADVPQTEGSPKTSPHGQKRRHETTESIQESITIVSTPGPTDMEEIEDVATPELPHESTSMDVDDVPPVKRVRPDSQVVIVELPDESAAPSSDASEQVATAGTPASHLVDFDEGEVDGETVDATEATAVETGETTTTADDEEQEAQDSAVAADAAEDHTLEEDLEEEGLDASFGTPGATDVTGLEDVEEEEGDLDLDLDHQHQEHEGDGDAPESAA